MQKIIIIVLVVLAANFLLRRMRAHFGSGGAHKGCGKCGCGEKAAAQSDQAKD